jgi:ubiquitin-protein ligase
MDLRRVKIEAARLSKDSESAGVSAKPISEDMKRWKGTITMPEDTPCVGGSSFTIDIDLTDYPASILKSP